ncbi:TraX family protein [Enterobacter roggenkampii]|uniref:TraX family protein n=1 Tax=Enterobacter roggenkampii TaxID=1812935 RepID=UPI00370382D3
MIIDHTNTVFLSPAWPVMYALGRMAFPLFTLIWGLRANGTKTYAKKLIHCLN